MSPTPYRPVSYLEENVRRRPHELALVDAGHALTFADLLRHVWRFAAALVAAGLRANGVVGVHLANLWEYVALELAIPEVGGIVMPLPLSLGARELEGALEGGRGRRPGV